MHMFSVKAKLTAEVFYIKTVIKSTLTAAYGKFSFPLKMDRESFSALSQSGL